ncbi:MAG: hypothetical protein KAQ98_08260 [Bacteriovoracaceae bacterium]|nr:hypothetical protein [Bacteriovoracaceae bacterium]
MTGKFGTRKGGVRDAAKMLSGLDVQNRTRVLESIAERDPEMAELLKQNMVLFDDLKYTTVQMIQELLREIKIEDLALALKIGGDDLKKHFLDNVSRAMREEIEEILNGKPVPMSKVQDAHDRIMKIVRVKVDRGELVLNPGSSEEYV